MFKTAIKSELCQISLTGMRALVLLGLLMDTPRTLDEIRAEFIKYNIMEKDNSDDIIRIDINTLRYMGCDITRATKKNNYKYTLLNNPFSIQITQKEVEVVKRAYKLLQKDMDTQTLLGYDFLFRKIAKHVMNEDIKQRLLGISVLKSLNTDLVSELLDSKNSKKVIQIIYQPPTSKKSMEMEILVTDIVLNNEKLYLYGTNLFNKEAVMLQIKRILSIISKRSSEEEDIAKPVVVKFMLSEFGINGLDPDEKFIGKFDDKYLIEGKYHNEFIAIQRILSFGSECTVIEPLAFREKIISKLKKIREIYKND